MTAPAQLKEFEWGKAIGLDSGKIIIAGSLTQLSISLAAPCICAVHPCDVVFEDKGERCTIESLWIAMDEIVEARGIPTRKWNDLVRHQLKDYPTRRETVITSQVQGLRAKLAVRTADSDAIVQMTAVAVPFKEKVPT